MIERYTNKKILRPCPPFGYASLRVACGSLALATLALRSPSAPCASAAPPCPPFGYASLRVACGSLALATLALRSPSAPCASAAPPCPPFGYASLRVACGSLAWPSAKSVGAPPQLPTHVLADPRRRRRLRLPGRPIALSRNPSNSAMSAESDFRSIGIPVFSQPCTEYR